MNSDGHSKARIRWGPDPPCKGATLSGKDTPGHAQRHSAVICAKMAQLTEMPFGFEDSGGRKEPRIRWGPGPLMERGNFGERGDPL